MKKVSTVAAKQSSNLCQPKLTIGLDLGDLFSWYCVLDEGGELQWERKVSTSAKVRREEHARRLWRRFPGASTPARSREQASQPA